MASCDASAAPDILAIMARRGEDRGTAAIARQAMKGCLRAPSCRATRCPSFRRVEAPQTMISGRESCVTMPGEVSVLFEQRPTM